MLKVLKNVWAFFQCFVALPLLAVAIRPFWGSPYRLWSEWMLARYQLKLDRIQIPKSQYDQMVWDLSFGLKPGYTSAIDDTTSAIDSTKVDSAKVDKTKFDETKSSKPLLLLLSSKQWGDSFVHSVVTNHRGYLISLSKLPLARKFLTGLWDALGTTSTVVGRPKANAPSLHRLAVYACLDQQLAVFEMLKRRKDFNKQFLVLYADAACIQVLPPEAPRPMDPLILDWAFLRGLRIQILETQSDTKILPSPDIFSSPVPDTQRVICVETPILNSAAYVDSIRFARAAKRAHAHAHAAAAEEALVRFLRLQDS